MTGRASILSAARSLVETAAGLFFSFPCPLCGNAGTAHNELCAECRKKIRFVKGPFCPGCGAELDGIFKVCSLCMREESRPWSDAVCAFRMEGEGKELLHKFKYQNHPELARPLGKLAAEALRRSDVKFDCVTPTPLHWTKKLARGYNQSELLAEALAAETGRPLLKLLRRSKMTRQQARLGREERKKNLKGAFSAAPHVICRKRAILLVDDVLTTGSTLAEETRVLLGNGAESVRVLVLARR